MLHKIPIRYIYQNMAYISYICTKPILYIQCVCLCFKARSHPAKPHPPNQCRQDTRSNDQRIWSGPSSYLTNSGRVFSSPKNLKNWVKPIFDSYFFQNEKNRSIPAKRGMDFGWGVVLKRKKKQGNIGKFQFEQWIQQFVGDDILINLEGCV